MPTTLTRYVVISFALGVALFAAFFLALFLVVDTLAHLDMFLAHPAGVWAALGCWLLLRAPDLAAEFSPLLLLGGAMLTVLHLRRSNELAACLSAGIPARRVLRPLWVLAVAAALALYAHAEWFHPYAARTLHAWDLNKDLQSRRFQFWAQDARGLRYYCEAYHHRQRLIEHLWAQEYDPARGHLARLVYAARARWEDAPRPGWRLFDGWELRLDAEGRRLAGPQPRDDVLLAEAALVPADLNRQLGIEDFPLSEALAIAAERGTGDVTEQAVVLHRRLSDPWRGPVLLVLAVPLLIDRRGRGLFGRGVACLIVAAGFFAVALFCLSLGFRGALPPAAATWGPLALFGAAGLWRWRRMAT